MMRTGINSHPADHSARSASAARGFSLIEMAVVLFVIALLLGSFLVPLGTQVEQRQNNDTQKTLEEIKEALIGFAVSKGYLPCPDKATAAGLGTANDGIEDVDAAGACVVALTEGNVPWVTLGVGASDVWGNRFRYQVTATFAQRTPAPSFTLSTAASINVCTADGCPANTRLTAVSPDGAVAVIISLGKNGLGAISASTGIANPDPPVGSDEYGNRFGPSQFVSRTHSSVTGAEFDDIVTWLSKHTLFNRMVAAGKLP